MLYVHVESLQKLAETVFVREGVRVPEIEKDRQNERESVYETDKYTKQARETRRERVCKRCRLKRERLKQIKRE